jgi:RNA polymerase subunit RPABC4/transcription elongation factor Spt4
MLDPILLKNILLALFAFSAAFLVTLWLGLIIWTFRDIRRRTRDHLVRVLAVLVTTVLFLPGVIIYLILRPSKTLDEEYQQTLEEEALLQSIEDAPQCPGCGRKTDKDWIACPNCYTRLRKPCHRCGKIMELAWNLCPYCGTPAPGMVQETSPIDESYQPAGVPSQIPLIELEKK